jgi:hypothetical protein
LEVYPDISEFRSIISVGVSNNIDINYPMVQMMIYQSLFDVLQSTHDQISQEFSALFHDPMAALHSVNLASLVFQKIVLPFSRSEVEGLPLSINKSHRNRRCISIEEKLSFVENTRKKVLPHVEVGVTSCT